MKTPDGQSLVRTDTKVDLPRHMMRSTVHFVCIWKLASIRPLKRYWNSP